MNRKRNTCGGLFFSFDKNDTLLDNKKNHSNKNEKNKKNLS